MYNGFIPAQARLMMKKFILDLLLPELTMAARTKVLPITIIANRIQRNTICSV